MNDKDKEAFVKFMDEGLPCSYYDSYHCREKEAWQAACEYKQKEIDDLVAENAKLRECVEFYSVNGLGNVTVGSKIDTKLMHQFYINGGYARQVLKELDEKL